MSSESVAQPTASGKGNKERITKPLTVPPEAARAYEEQVSRARISKSREPIPNRYPWHCKIAVKELLQFASDLQQRQRQEPVIIRVLTGTLTQHVYAIEMLEAISAFIAAGGRIHVLVWNTRESVVQSHGENGILSKLIEPGHFEVKVLGTREHGERVNHFFTVGNEAYRLEAPHKYVEATEFNDFAPEISARICFNDPETSHRLITFFDSLWKALPMFKIDDAVEPLTVS